MPDSTFSQCNHCDHRIPVWGCDGCREKRGEFYTNVEHQLKLIRRSTEELSKCIEEIPNSIKYDKASRALDVIERASEAIKNGTRTF